MYDYEYLRRERLLLISSFSRQLSWWKREREGEGRGGEGSGWVGEGGRDQNGWAWWREFMGKKKFVFIRMCCSWLIHTIELNWGLVDKKRMTHVTRVFMCSSWHIYSWLVHMTKQNWGLVDEKRMTHVTRVLMFLRKSRPRSFLVVKFRPLCPLFYLICTIHSESSGILDLAETGGSFVFGCQKRRCRSRGVKPRR